MPETLSDDLIRYYRRVLALHTTSPEAGACEVCGVPRCPDQIDAYNRLVAAGQLMPGSPPWEPFSSGQDTGVSCMATTANTAGTTKAAPPGAPRIAAVPLPLRPEQGEPVSHPNWLLHQARLRLLSPSGSGRPMSRQELAEAVNAYLFRRTKRVYTLDAHYVGRLERGVRRWPNADYRAGFRAVLGARSDAELGFSRSSAKLALVGRQSNG